MEQIKAILQLATVRIPPPEGAHHAFIVESGHLTLIISKGKVFYPFRIEPDDYERSPEAIVDDIENTLKSLGKGQIYRGWGSKR